MTRLFDLPESLEILQCSNNPLTFLELPSNLLGLFCDDTELTEIKELPLKLTILSCCRGSLHTLPLLPPNLRDFFCCENQLDHLPILPDSLKVLLCEMNKLKTLPDLPLQLLKLQFKGNPVYDIIGKNENVSENVEKMLLNAFRYNYYCHKFRGQFRLLLWEGVREKKIQELYSPDNVEKYLEMAKGTLEMKLDNYSIM